MVLKNKSKTKKPAEAPKKVVKNAPKAPSKRPADGDDESQITMGNNTSAVLKGFIERIERLMEEKAGIAGDIRDVYVEVGATGLDKKTVRKVIALRKQDVEKRRAEQELIELYCAAIGLA